MFALPSAYWLGDDAHPSNHRERIKQFLHIDPWQHSNSPATNAHPDTRQGVDCRPTSILKLAKLIGGR